MRRVVCLTLALALSMFLPCIALEPYINYTYDKDGMPWKEPQAYYPAEVLRGEDLGAGSLKSPGDLFVAPDGRIYVADTGNHRILRLTADMRLQDEFKTFGEGDAFQNPHGVFVTGDNRIYVADTDKARIVVLDEQGGLVEILEEPRFDIDEKFIYAPVRVAVDAAGRVFVISKNINYGMIELDKNGGFTGFFGAIKVTPRLGDTLWRMIATQAQRDKMLQNVPTEYSSNAVDEEGFLYGAISTQTAQQFTKKLNPLGNDVLRRLGAVPPDGDVPLPDENGDEPASVLVDICVRPGGVYSVLDSRRGRVFTYDNDGNLLYVFGATGNRMGCFVKPVALDATARGRYLVVDGGANHITVFAATDYADKINSAVQSQYERQYEQAEQKWLEILQYTAKSEMAYREIGKAYYRQGEYRKAMEYFEMAGDKQQYSKSYKELRRLTMDNSFDAVMAAGSVGAVLAAVLLIARRVRRKKGKTG